MDIFDVIKARHSIRRYKDLAVEDDKKSIINQLISDINAENKLHIQAIYNDKNAFDCTLSKYGNFRNVSNYIALVGKGAKVEEKLGYFGEEIVLKLTELGLGSCFVAISYSKKKAKIVKEKDEKLYLVIGFGYADETGTAHKSKKFEAVTKINGEMIEGFQKGVEAALLAPTAVNQQKFKIILNNGKVTIKESGIGFYTSFDLGIVRYNFEIASGIKTK